VIDAIAKFGDERQEIILNEGRALKPGHMMVVHLTLAKGNRPRQIVAIEEYAPFID